MGYTLKRLALGIALIGLAAAVLLVSDWQHRQSARPSGSAPADQLDPDAAEMLRALYI